MIKIEITWIGGNCPVQAEGKVNGELFYFRARGNKWALSIDKVDPIPIGNEPNWYYSEPYGDEPFAAGYMTEEEAIEFIKMAIRKRYPGENLLIV